MSTSLPAIVHAREVRKAYGSFTAVKDLSFDIIPGECFGLLGPNGAGKSTMIKMIYGVIPRSAGKLSVLGLDPTTQAKQLRRSLGVVMQEDALDDAMDVTDNMLMFSRFHEIPKHAALQRIRSLLEFMELSHKSKERISSLSGGMRRRLAFVRSLIAQPKLLVLDEPTTGLDPAVRQALWHKVNELKANGTTILLTTHYLDEAEFLCDRLVLMNNGLIQEQGSPSELIKKHCPGYVAVFKNPSNERKREWVECHSLSEISQISEKRGQQPTVIRPANLEDVFLKLTGRDLT